MQIFLRVLAICFAVLCLASIYFIPLGIAILRRQQNWLSILVLNLFLGWTLVGWVIALVWAVKKDSLPVAMIPVDRH